MPARHLPPGVEPNLGPRHPYVLHHPVLGLGLSDGHEDLEAAAAGHAVPNLSGAGMKWEILCLGQTIKWVWFFVLKFCAVFACPKKVLCFFKACPMHVSGV